jgi:ketosteroid isomerase-like protein
MRFFTVLAAIVLELACTPATGIAAGSSCSGHVTTGQTDSAATIRRLEHDWSAAYWSGDTAYLKCLYDPQMQSINAKGRRTSGAQDIAGAVPFADPKKRLAHTSTILSLDVVVHGWFAVATGVTRRNNVAPARQMRWSDVYVFDGTRWHAIFSQDTRVQ